MTCHFALRGFTTSSGTKLAPCGIRYHQQCIRVGSPFTTRLRHGGGLSFPRVRHWGTFICELCTVRGILDRELHGSRDWKLLAYERMRIIDIANAWSRKTHSSYQSKLSYIQQFEAYFQFKCLRSRPLRRPPNDASIPLMWIQECFSLRPGRSGTDTVAFGSIRPLRSAASHFLAWDAILHTNGASYMDTGRRVYHGPCRATDNLAYTLFTTGQSTRIGDNPRPSTALLDRHVRWIDSNLRQRYHLATSQSERLFLLKSGFLNLLLWLGWLRAMESLDLRWCDVSVVYPWDSASADLPTGMGALTFRLAPATKTFRTITADVAISYNCRSGLSLGWWWSALVHTQWGNTDWMLSTDLIFTTPPSGQWTSLFYRTQVLYPALYAQQLQGDPFLRPFLEGTENSIPRKYWSFNSYRRGGRSHVDRFGPDKRYRATQPQIYEHGHWRLKRSSKPIDVQYREWPLRDRLLITFYSF